MFKKLKKKLEEESSGSSSLSGGREQECNGPGLASPLRIETATNGSSPPKKDFDTMSLSSGTSEPREATSKEDVLRLLMKRTEQVRKLEGKITDLAALIKEKNRNVDRLESALEKQSIESERQIQELNTQVSANRARRTESSEKREEMLQKELEDIKKYAVELEDQVSAAQSLKDRLYRQEEQNDETLGLATQEMAKVKHLLLNTQEELVRMKTELREKRELHDLATRKVQQLENEVQSLMQQITSLTTTHEDVLAENTRLQASVEDERSQKHGVERQLHTVQKLHTTLNKQLIDTQQQLQQLQETYNTARKQHTTQIQKLEEELSAREERIGRLEETTGMLEQRIKDGALSGDDRVTALEEQRCSLEEKLNEAREQMSQQRTDTNKHTQQLQEQITALKSSLDDEETIAKATSDDLNSLREESNHQVSELQSRLEEAQRRAKHNWDELADRERQVERQNSKHLDELSRQQELYKELETDMQQKVTTLEVQMKKLEKMHEEENHTTQSQLQEEWLEKELDLEKKLSDHESQVTHLHTLLLERENEMKKLQQQLSMRDRQTAHTADRLKSVEEELKSQKIIMEQHKSEMMRATRDSQAAHREKSDAVSGRAALLQEMEKIRTQEADTRRELEREMRQKDTSIAGLERAVEILNTELTETQQQLSSLQTSQSLAANEAAQMAQLHRDNAALEAQLIEKNKTIKMQQQRMTDLKKTLQREFKVQALPNDDPPPPPQTFTSSSYGGLAKSSSTPQGLNMLPDNYMHKAPSSSSGGGGHQLTVHKHLQLEESWGTHDNHAAIEYNRDINFKYLRHVVLKFMLSRETEALHLIKAVSVLLDFTHDEQQMLKDTLEYKMSWFGGFKSSSGRAGGQMAKSIPPSF